MALRGSPVKRERAACYNSGMKAMVLAAGMGTRLRPLTDSVPKPLAPIGNVPLLERTLIWLGHQGCKTAVVNLHYLPEQVRDTLGSGERLSIELWYSHEPELLGTSGALANAAGFFDSDEPLLVVYGDNLIEADLQPLLQLHREKSADVTMALFTPDDPSACGMVEVDSGGAVISFIEKPAEGQTPATLANAGIYVLNGSLLAELPSGAHDFGSDIFPAWLAAGKRIFAAPLQGYLQDTGTPERYRRANWDVLEGRLKQRAHGRLVGGSVVGEGAIIDPSARLESGNLIGASCVIAEDVRLTDCILWPGAAIERGSMLTNVIVGCDAVVPQGTHASDAILV